MSSFTSLLVAYLLGGVTFLPLVVLAIFFHGLYTLPVASPTPPTDAADDDLVQPGDDTATLDAAKKSHKDEGKQRPHGDVDVAAGYFAVCREYTPMGINAKPIERSTPVGSTTVAAPSPSVYQTMYRSIFERKPASGPLDNNGHNASQRPKKAGNVFYVALRHGHLMLFDDEEQVEVRHVISLAHHEISMYSGGDTTPEGELFIKRNALCLSRKQGGADLGPDSQTSKPFYLFSENCSAKEDFYFALLKSQAQTFQSDGQGPAPLQFEVKNIISLVQKLHSTEDNMHWRWLNAMLGRVFLGIYKTKDIEAYIREKITKKLTRVKKPSFLTNVNIQGISTGESAPYFTNIKMKDLTVEGECVMEADVKYSGNFRIEVAATVKIDLGTRFKAREVNLVLAVVLKRAEGHMMFKIKPPPSNRIWFTFQTMPKLEMAIEPIVSTRQITYTVILRQIENRIKEVVAETLVQPFWDDVPFFNTEHKKWRGGIFEGDDATVPSKDAEAPVAQTGDVEAVSQMEETPDESEETVPLEKSHTIPVMESIPSPSPSTGLFGRRLSRASNTPSAAASSTSLDVKGASASPLLSPRVKATEPVTGTDAAHAEIFKPASPPDFATDYMAAIHFRSQDASPRTTPGDPSNKPIIVTDRSSRSSSVSKGHSDNAEQGDVQDEAPGDGHNDDDKTPVGPGRRNTASSTGSGTQSPTKAASLKESLKSQTGSLGRNFFMRRDSDHPGSDAASINSDSSQKRTTLSAVTNAAVQARQWGLNALQRQKEARKQPEHLDLTQPMGRGQPLPPPGTPLPRPTNGSTRISAPAAVPLRKPVPSPHQPERESAESLETHQSHDQAKQGDKSPRPARRRRGQSYVEEGEEEGQNMLVIAAPNDSAPATPSAEEQSNYQNSWPGDASDEQTLAESAAESQQDLLQPRSVSPAKKDDLDLDGPVEALPAASAAETNGDDDDDYSPWLDDSLDDVDAKEPVSAPVAQEVN